MGEYYPDYIKQYNGIHFTNYFKRNSNNRYVYILIIFNNKIDTREHLKIHPVSFTLNEVMMFGSEPYNFEFFTEEQYIEDTLKYFF